MICVQSKILGILPLRTCRGGYHTFHRMFYSSIKSIKTSAQSTKTSLESTSRKNFFGLSFLHNQKMQIQKRYALCISDRKKSNMVFFTDRWFKESNSEIIRFYNFLKKNFKALFEKVVSLFLDYFLYRLPPYLKKANSFHDLGQWKVFGF